MALEILLATKAGLKAGERAYQAGERRGEGEGEGNGGENEPTKQERGGGKGRERGTEGRTSLPSRREEGGKGRERGTEGRTSLPCRREEGGRGGRGERRGEQAYHAGHFGGQKVIQMQRTNASQRHGVFIPSRKHPVFPMECWLYTRKLIQCWSTCRCLCTCAVTFPDRQVQQKALLLNREMPFHFDRSLSNISYVVALHHVRCHKVTVSNAIATILTPNF